MPLYLTTRKGEKLLKPNNLSDQEYQKLFSLAPTEYELIYRTRNIEYSVLNLILSFSTYKMAIWLLQSEYLTLGIASLLFFFVFVGLLAGYVGRVVSVPISDFLYSISRQTKYLLYRKLDTISNVIVILIIISVLTSWYWLNQENFINALPGIIIGTLIGGFTGIVQTRRFFIWVLSRIRDGLFKQN